MVSDCRNVRAFTVPSADNGNGGSANSPCLSDILEENLYRKKIFPAFPVGFTDGSLKCMVSHTTPFYAGNGYLSCFHCDKGADTGKRRGACRVFTAFTP